VIDFCCKSNLTLFSHSAECPPPHLCDMGDDDDASSWWRVDGGGAIAFRNSCDMKDEADRAKQPPAGRLTVWKAGRCVEAQGVVWIQANGLWLPTTYMDELQPLEPFEVELEGGADGLVWLPGCCPLVLAQVLAGYAVESHEQLRPGQVLLAVQGQDVTNAGHAAVMQKLSEPGVLRLRLQPFQAHPSSSSSSSSSSSLSSGAAAAAASEAAEKVAAAAGAGLVRAADAGKRAMASIESSSIASSVRGMFAKGTGGGDGTGEEVAAAAAAAESEQTRGERLGKLHEQSPAGEPEPSSSSPPSASKESVSARLEKVGGEVSAKLEKVGGEMSRAFGSLFSKAAAATPSNPPSTVAAAAAKEQEQEEEAEVSSGGEGGAGQSGGGGAGGSSGEGATVATESDPGSSPPSSSSSSPSSALPTADESVDGGDTPTYGAETPAAGSEEEEEVIE
jgi:hypothetical protein